MIVASLYCIYLGPHTFKDTFRRVDLMIYHAFESRELELLKQCRGVDTDNTKPEVGRELAAESQLPQPGLPLIVIHRER